MCRIERPQWIRASLLSSRFFSTYMRLTMLKQSFLFLLSYKYAHLKRNFFSGTNVEDDVEDVAFPVFGFAKTTAVVVWHTLFDPTIPGDCLRRQLRLIRSRCQWIFYARGWRVKMWSGIKKISFTELTGRFITRETIFVCCSQNVVLRGEFAFWSRVEGRGQLVEGRG